MVEPTVFLVFLLVVICGVVVLSAVMSNRRARAETLEEANKRLVKVKEEYNAFANFPTSRRYTKK